MPKPCGTTFTKTSVSRVLRASPHVRPSVRKAPFTEPVPSYILLCVFFSSRRRHTRCSRDWSSDVCSSDLFSGAGEALMSNYIPILQQTWFLAGLLLFAAGFAALTLRAMGAIPPVGQWMEGAAALGFGLNTAAGSG